MTDKTKELSPSEIAAEVIELVQKHGWAVPLEGFTITRVIDGNIERFDISGTGADRRLGTVTLPDRPYEVVVAGSLMTIKSE